MRARHTQGYSLSLAGCSRRGEGLGGTLCELLFDAVPATHPRRGDGGHTHRSRKEKSAVRSVCVCREGASNLFNLGAAGGGELCGCVLRA